MVGDRWLAPAQSLADAVRLVPAQKHDVEIGLIVAEISIGALGRGLAIEWMILNETRNVLELSCCPARRHVLEIFNLGGLRDAWNCYGNGSPADLWAKQGEHNRLRQDPSPLSGH
jgi:hypothetical protein